MRRRFADSEPRVRASTTPPRVRVFDVGDQRDALKQLATLVEHSILVQRVNDAALLILEATGTRRDRDDEGEIQAIFDAVKTGTPAVPGLENGFHYVADPRQADLFRAPYKILEKLARGINGGDCDDFASLTCALLGTLGFRVGLRAWGPTPDEFVHVYAVVGFPKRNPQEAIGLDGTVTESSVGWEPPGGATLTAWLE